MNTLYRIINAFRIQGQVDRIETLGEGFINDTYMVKTKDEKSPNYILQRKNQNIFTNIPGMMNNIEKISQHLKKKVIKNNGDPMKEALTVIQTHQNQLYYIDDNKDFWVVTLFIDDCVTYDQAKTPELAYAGGKGIGKFQRLTSDFYGNLADTLPGFHNIRYRFKQWDAVISDDPLGRKAKLTEEISWIESRRNRMMKFWELVENGSIPKRVTHNDTKINNILFDQSGRVLCVIDLDTVLKSTVLNDFGDAIRSYTNTGLEDDQNLSKVSLDINMFNAYTEGYLSETNQFLTPIEMEYLAFAAQFITFEQVLRFLMDYINGDKYYKIKSPHHNLIRTRAQHQLLMSMEQQFDEMQRSVSRIGNSFKR